MYQEIDDPEWEQAEEKERKRTLWLGVCLTLILILIAGSLWFVFNATPETEPQIEGETQLQTVQYRNALSEPSPPLRRARLMDFLETHPDTARKSAIEAQLSILNTAESEDWAVLTDSIYNPAVTDTDKHGAIDIYIRAWGPVYLGTREDEISDFTENLTPRTPSLDAENGTLDTITQDTESEGFNQEDFQAPAPDYPTNLSDTVLAGGISQPAREVVQMPAPRPVVIQTVRNIVPPKVRKNVTPRYPKSAQRRGIAGTVTLSLNINAEGRVDLINVMSVNARRYGKDFEKSARRAAKRTRFFPQTVDGVPTPVSGVIKRYRFEIEE